MDDKSKLIELRDGDFKHYFDKSKFKSFASNDSVIYFDFVKCKLTLRGSNNDSLIVDFNHKYKKINDSIVNFPFKNYFHIDTTKLLWDKYSIQINIVSGRKFYYNIIIEWGNRIIYLTTLYKNSKLATIYSIDTQNEIGLTLSGSFRTGKYIWNISPHYIKERLDEQTNRIVIYNKLEPFLFYYEFNFRGRFKTKKSSGRAIFL